MFPSNLLTYLLCCETKEWDFSVTWAGSQWDVVCNRRGCPRVPGNHWSHPHRSEQCRCHWQIYWTPPHSTPLNKNINYIVIMKEEYMYIPEIHLKYTEIWYRKIKYCSDNAEFLWQLNFLSLVLESKSFTWKYAQKVKNNLIWIHYLDMDFPFSDWTSSGFILLSVFPWPSWPLSPDPQE